MHNAMKVDPQDYYNSRNLFINIVTFILISENRLSVVKFLYFRLLCLFSAYNLQKRILTVVF